MALFNKFPVLIIMTRCVWFSQIYIVCLHSLSLIGHIIVPPPSTQTFLRMIAHKSVIQSVVQQFTQNNPLNRFLIQ